MKYLAIKNCAGFDLVRALSSVGLCGSFETNIAGSDMR